MIPRPGRLWPRGRVLATITPDIMGNTLFIELLKPLFIAWGGQAVTSHDFLIGDFFLALAFCEFEQREKCTRETAHSNDSMPLIIAAPE